jgi:hypothetical protein
MQRLTCDTRERHLGGEVEHDDLSALFHNRIRGWSHQSANNGEGGHSISIRMLQKWKITRLQLMTDFGIVLS